MVIISFPDCQKMWLQKWPAPPNWPTPYNPHPQGKWGPRGRIETVRTDQTGPPVVSTNQKITRKGAAFLGRISDDQAGRLLRKLNSESKLRREGKGRSAPYFQP